VADVSIGSIYRVVFKSRMGGQNGINVKYLSPSLAVGGGLTELQFANVLQNEWATLVSVLMSDQASAVSTTIQKTNPLPAAAAVTSTVAATVGTLGGDPLPPQTAGLIKLTTALAGRSGRGRLYVPFPSENVNTAAGVPSAGYIVNLGALGDNFVGLKTAGVGGDGVQYRWGLKPSFLEPLVLRPFVGQVPRVAWATQRRRSFVNRGDAP